MEWQPYEAGKTSILAAPLEIAPGVHAVLELFDKRDAADKPADFTQADIDLTTAVADFGITLMRQALAEHQSQQVLLDAVSAAMHAGESVAQSLGPARVPGGRDSTDAASHDDRAGEAILDQLRQSLSESRGTAVAPEQSVRLAENVRRLALAHGPLAVEHCIRLIDSVRELLDSATGATS